ncbi:MAG: D-alanine--D-alanine ligase [Bacteroidaceae bacterium]|nr:D-alanine--D-alanine ligase [Bacteroidales bacterium]MBQ3188993.1 D-alanine--D-alanine ligase [Bacteroidaceae bacterium]MBR7135170.1 D-alanine--D-alanine ligase [Bacteroidaceae bacterium]
MKTNVGVVFGGRSVENEISVITANQAIQAMDKEKYDITPIYITKTGKWYSGEALLNVDNYRDTKKLLSMCEEVYMRPCYGDTNLYRVKKGLFQNNVVAKLDVVLPALHGTNCEDGTFQGIMEFCGIPYTGCNTLASANGMDKITMKMILKECGIPVVDYCWFSDKEWDDKKDVTVANVESKLGYPVIVKPANSGSSVGIRAAHNREELLDAVDYAISFTNRVIIEKYVQKLKEVNCAVLGNYYECTPSVCEVPVRSGEILSYQDKYMSGGKQSQGMRSTQREIPANLPDESTAFIQQAACDTFRALDCDGVARIDFIIDEATGDIYVNEINTIPGSLSYYLWEYSGINFSELIDKLIEIAFRRKQDFGFKAVNYGGNIFAAKSAGGSKTGGKFGAKTGGKF